MNKLQPIEKAKLDTLLATIRVYLNQFKKTPTNALAQQVLISNYKLRKEIEKHYKIGDNKEIKINGLT
jgi:hypothetical protein